MEFPISLCDGWLVGHVTSGDIVRDIFSVEQSETKCIEKKEKRIAVYVKVPV